MNRILLLPLVLALVPGVGAVQQPSAPEVVWATEDEHDTIVSWVPPRTQAEDVTYNVYGLVDDAKVLLGTVPGSTTSFMAPKGLTAYGVSRVVDGDESETRWGCIAYSRHEDPPVVINPRCVPVRVPPHVVHKAP